MIVYFDDYTDTIFLEGLDRLPPARTLQARLEGNLIEIWFLAGNPRRIAGPFDYGTIQDRDGNSFPTPDGVLQYLQNEFTKGHKLFQYLDPLP